MCAMERKRLETFEICAFIMIYILVVLKQNFQRQYRFSMNKRLVDLEEFTMVRGKKVTYNNTHKIFRILRKKKRNVKIKKTYLLLRTVICSYFQITF